MGVHTLRLEVPEGPRANGLCLYSTPTGREPVPAGAGELPGRIEVSAEQRDADPRAAPRSGHRVRWGAYFPQMVAGRGADASLMARGRDSLRSASVAAARRGLGASPRGARGARLRRGLPPPAPWPPPTAQPRVEPRPEGRFTVSREVFAPEERAQVTGVALGDCDNDGLLDAVTLGARARFSLYAGRGGGRFELAVPEIAPTNVRSATFVDLDGDGLDDLVTADQTVDIYRNLGGCRFAPGREVAPRVLDFAHQVLATDVNLDGLTDFSVIRFASERAPQRLLVARGDGSYDDLTPPLSPYDPSQRMGPQYFGFGAYYADVDGDGAQDLFSLLDQQQGWFSWGDRASAALRRDEPLTAAFARVDPMSLSPIDFDRDGRVDWFVSGVLSRSLLLWHRGGRDVREAAELAGLSGVGNDFAWGSYAFDADLDGWTDVLVRRVGIDLPHPMLPPTGPTDLFLNRHDGTFAEVGATALGASLRAKTLTCGPSAAARRGRLLLGRGRRRRPRAVRQRLRARGTVRRCCGSAGRSAPPTRPARA